MQEVFEKILEKMEELKKCGTKHYEDGKYIYTSPDYDHGTLNKTIEIVKQEAEKFGTDINVGSNGWIPVSERLPKEFDTVLVTMADDCKGFPHMQGSLDIGYLYNRIRFCCACGTYSIDDIIAWQPLPQPYQPKGE